jgi:hypothetical protein
MPPRRRAQKWIRTHVHSPETSTILHESGGHRNARDNFRDLEAAGVPVHHLKRYIWAHKCKWCEFNLGRKSYYCQKARQPGGDLEISTIIHLLNPKITERAGNMSMWDMYDDDVFYLFLQKQKRGAELHIYLEEGTVKKARADRGRVTKS